MKYLFLVGGAVFVVVRAAIYFISKSSQKSLMNKIKKDPSKALEYVTNLDVSYAKRENCDAQSFELIKNKIASSSKIGAYQILHVQPIDDYQFLVFTALSFTDFDVNLTGRSSDVNKSAYHDFVFHYDKSAGELTINSGLYFNATEKFQKAEFITSLFESSI